MYHTITFVVCLVGACVAGLGEEIAAMYSNSDKLSDALLQAAEVGVTPALPLLFYRNHKPLPYVLI